MRKLFQSVLISVDGVVTNAGQWAMPFFNEESTADAVAQLDRSDAMLFGRLTFQELSQQWASAPGPFAERLRVIKKYVFSATLHDPAWANTVVVRTDPVQAVRELKNEGQGDLTIYGTAVAQTLLESDLLRRLTLSIHPRWSEPHQHVSARGRGSCVSWTSLRAVRECSWHGTAHLTSLEAGR